MRSFACGKRGSEAPLGKRIDIGTEHDIHCRSFRVLTGKTWMVSGYGSHSPAALDLIHFGWVHYSYYFKSVRVLELSICKFPKLKKTVNVSGNAQKAFECDPARFTILRERRAPRRSDENGRRLVAHLHARALGTAIKTNFNSIPLCNETSNFLFQLVQLLQISLKLLRPNKISPSLAFYMQNSLKI